MKDKPAESADTTPQPSRSSRRRPTRKTYIVIVLIAVIVVAGFLFIPHLLNTRNDNDSNTTKVLTIDDLDDPKVELGSNTSDASVANLSKDLKSKIDKQIANKENPIDTLTTLVGVLCNTTNAGRSYQCVDYIKDFLDTKMETLKFNSDSYGQPDDLQITYWRAQLYVNLISSYKFIVQNNFADTDSKRTEAVSEQLKYIDLYLAIAQDAHNRGAPQTAEDGRTWYFYNYDDVDDLTVWRAQLESGELQ